MLEELPKSVSKYSSSPVFDKDSVPQALRKEHRTKPGVWAKAIVLEGSIDFIFEDKPDDPITIQAGNFAIAEPEVPHHVNVTGPVKFQLEFYREEK